MERRDELSNQPTSPRHSRAFSGNARNGPLSYGGFGGTQEIPIRRSQGSPKSKKEGRGAGSGVAHVPWLKINDVASQGRSPNIGHRNQRVPRPQGLHADTVGQV
jgi:hypothetical protein